MGIENKRIAGRVDLRDVTLVYKLMEPAGRWSMIGWVERSETQHKISSRLKKKEQTIRQRRFWEQLSGMIRMAHRGLMKVPGDWEYSSFHPYVREGMYDAE
jgi:hypothetical protein